MREGFIHSKSLKQIQFSKRAVFGIGSTIQAVQEATAGLGVGLNGGVVLERFLVHVQSEISAIKRVDYRRKLKLMVISVLFRKVPL